jgi:hypothetical protein
MAGTPPLIPGPYLGNWVFQWIFGWFCVGAKKKGGGGRAKKKGEKSDKRA